MAERGPVFAPAKRRRLDSDSSAYSSSDNDVEPPSGNEGFSDISGWIEAASREERVFEDKQFAQFRDRVAKARLRMQKETARWRFSRTFADARAIQRAQCRDFANCEISQELTIARSDAVRESLKDVRENFRERAREALARGARSDLGVPASYPFLPSIARASDDRTGCRQTPSCSRQRAELA